MMYYNSITSAARGAPSVETFQSGLTSQIRKMVNDNYPHWRDALDPSETWHEYGGSVD